MFLTRAKNRGLPNLPPPTTQRRAFRCKNRCQGRASHVLAPNVVLARRDSSGRERGPLRVANRRLPRWASKTLTPKPLATRSAPRIGAQRVRGGTPTERARSPGRRRTQQGRGREGESSVPDGGAAFTRGRTPLTLLTLQPGGCYPTRHAGSMGLCVKSRSAQRRGSVADTGWSCRRCRGAFRCG